MQSLRQQKQQYLRENILENNYDAQQFMEFCQNCKGSVDIDSWTFNELVEIVGEFIKSQNHKNQQKKPTQFDQMFSNSHKDWSPFNNWSQMIQPQKDNPKSIDLNLIDLDFLQGISSPKGTKGNSSNLNQFVQHKNKPQNIMLIPNEVAKKIQQGNQGFIVGYNNVNSNISPQKQHQRSYTQPQQGMPKQQTLLQSDTQTFETQLQCRKITVKTKLIGNQEVIVSGHQIINPNVFIPNYVLYTITINPLNLEVKRKMKDFQTLRNLLKKLFPTTQIPFLERYGRLSETEPVVIKKQKLFIQSFLNNLLINPDLRCKLLEDFLLCQDNDGLKKIFKQYEKLEKPRAAEQLYTQSGRVKIKLDPTNKKYLDQQSLYLVYIQTNFAKIKALYDQFVNGLTQNIKILMEISETFQNLTENTKNLNNSFSYDYKSNNIQKTFQCLTHLHKQWGNSFKTQVKIVQTELRHLFRFQQSNTQTIKQIVKLNDVIVNQSYLRRTDRDQSTKQGYQSKKLYEYKISLQNPSKNITVLKYQAAYIQHQAVTEFKRYLSQLSMKLNNKYSLFCIMQLNIDNDLDNIWKDFEKSTKV